MILSPFAITVSHIILLYDFDMKEHFDNVVQRCILLLICKSTVSVLFNYVCMCSHMKDYFFIIQIPIMVLIRNNCFLYHLIIYYDLLIKNLVF